MSKIDYAATPLNFALLGIYDRAYLAYESINTIYEKGINENINPRYGECTLGIRKLTEIYSAQIKKILNSFFEQHLSIFTDEFFKLYVNSVMIRRHDWYNWDMKITDDPKSNGFSYKYWPITFKKFLFALEDIVIDVALQRKKQSYPAISRNEVLNQVDNRIKSLASQSWISRKTNYLKNQLDISQLIVFKSLPHISCNQSHHEIVAEDCLVPLVGNKNQAVLLPIHRCLSCGKKFVGFRTYKLFTEEFGPMVFERIPGDPDDTDFYDDFASESKLHRFGYNVIDGLLSEKERHSILINLLENGWMSYYEICRDIEHAINIFFGRSSFIVAVDKWQKDLKFISEFIIENPQLGK